MGILTLVMDVPVTVLWRQVIFVPAHHQYVPRNVETVLV